MFVGFANGDLVVGVWVGNDDNTSNPGLHGGGVPARIWRTFMQSALNIAPVAAPVADDEATDPEATDDNTGDDTTAPIEGTLEGFGVQMKMGKDGSITVDRAPRDDQGPPPPRDDRRPNDEPPEDEQ